MTKAGTLQKADLVDPEALKEELGEIAWEFERLGERLLKVHADLPLSSREDLMLLGEEDPDFSCSVRSAIECAMADCLKPLVKVLRAAATWEA